MPERWVGACRRLVPEPFRSSSVEPTLADLQRDWLVRPRGPWGRRLAIALVALECRRLAARAVVSRLVHLPESRFAMIWFTLIRASRLFVRQPGLALVIVLTLAVGIGA